MKQQENDKQTVMEDLSVEVSKAEEVKGGRFIGVGELQECTISKSMDHS